MGELTNDEIFQLWEDIQTDNAVLFLGQNYQKVYNDKNLFVDTINAKLCGSKLSSPSYPSLWKYMINKTGGKRLSKAQKDSIYDIANMTPKMERLSDTVSIGWASIITSAIDPGITNVIPCNPIYSPRTVVAGLGNKKKLHVSYVCGCTNEMDTVFDGEKFVGSTKSNAQQMIRRVYDDAIRYSGSLIIDGWDPSKDWIKPSTLLGTFDADVMYPAIFIFSASDDLITQLEEDDDTSYLADSARIKYCSKSFYDCMEEYIQQQLDEEESDVPSETLTFNLGKRTVSITIPNEAIKALGNDDIHILTPKDRIKISLDSIGLRGVTSRFLSTTGNSFPYWQGYQQGCYFKRDIYTTKNGDGLKDLTLHALTAGNLHQVKSMIILHGPSNSGKSVLLGKLAIDLSVSYPVIYIKGDLPDNSDLGPSKYASLVNFINQYIAGPCREKRINRGRILVIWDNNAFYENIHDYIELKRELSESNAVLVCSAYETVRQNGKKNKYNSREIMYIGLSARLSSDSEINAMYSMLNNNLGDEYGEILKEIRTKNKSKAKHDETDLLTNDDRILYLIQRIFQHDQDQGLAQISLEAQLRTAREASGNNEMMKDYLEKFFSTVTDTYRTDIKGLAEIAKQLADDDKKDEEWFKETVQCAPTLNDIIAVAGQFGIRLPLDLVISVLIDFYPKMYFYTDVIYELLQNDSMLEFPFPHDAINQVLIGYRSPDEADIYLRNYSNRPFNIDSSITTDSNGNPFREDREIEILKSIIQRSNLKDYNGTNFYTLKIVKELIDQFGPNSRMGESFGDKYKYKYDEIAACILENGGDINPEMALTAAFLRREQIKNDLLTKYINTGKNIGQSELQILNSAEEGLSSAIDIETSSGSENSTRLMRLYVEWCTNRNYIYHRENPSKEDIDLYYRIHERFMKALRIYLSNKDNKMKSNAMLDVYLNAFINYADAAEKIYGIQSFPEHADPIIYEKYTQEVSFVMTWIIGKLFNQTQLDSSKTNFNSNLLKTYKLAMQPTDQLKTRARAVGSGAFILLKARSLWIEDVAAENSSKLPTDFYLDSDFAKNDKPLPESLIKAAKRVYAYLTERDNLSVITSYKKNTNTEIACLEMLIRSAWISKTGYMPFTLNQRPVLNLQDWEELHKYCSIYIKQENDQAKYAFAYYFEGMYYWIFTNDVKTNNFSKRPSQVYFDYCYQYCYKPRGLNYYSDSFLILCCLGTNTPIVFNARITKNKQRETATIINAISPMDIVDMPNVEHRSDIYYASTLNKRELNYNATSQTTDITIRFNLKGALSGPLPKDEED